MNVEEIEKTKTRMIKTDPELIKGLLEGNEAAFRELVEIYRQQVYNTCLSFVKNEEDADDLAQEVFISVYKNIHQFRMESKLTTWIYRIAVTKSLEAIRSDKRKKRFAYLRSLFYNDDSPMDIPDFNHPGILAENRERGQILVAAIEKLPENQRVAYTLNKMEDLSYQEIAAVMNKNLSSVESLLHRAKNNLKKYLYTYYQSERK